MLIIWGIIIGLWLYTLYKLTNAKSNEELLKWDTINKYIKYTIILYIFIVIIKFLKYI